MVCEVCESGGCTACDVQSEELQFASMKEIEEFSYERRHQYLVIAG
jgi:hypothetical protein